MVEKALKQKSRALGPRLVLRVGRMPKLHSFRHSRFHLYSPFIFVLYEKFQGQTNPLPFFYSFFISKPHHHEKEICRRLVAGKVLWIGLCWGTWIFDRHSLLMSLGGEGKTRICYHQTSQQLDFYCSFRQFEYLHICVVCVRLLS